MDKVPKEKSEAIRLKRRDFIKVSLLFPIGTFLAACARALESISPSVSGASGEIPSTESATAEHAVANDAAQLESEGQILVPTPACGDDDDDITPSQVAGPFYTPNTPLRSSLLEEGWRGIALVLSGEVLSTDCKPIAGALLDFWHADDVGDYDNVDFRYRGYQFTDDDGRFELRTIVPGNYPGRTKHIHVKVQAPNQAVLTTQLYFPDEPRNQSDGIFNPELLMTIEESAEGENAFFSFVLQA